ncbi:nitrous oxide reductase accessory protein NosL [Pseudoponticoccus marisrubri]|uniref:Copper resistance protein CopZ n=1 Tax=Pseudoponticoccus marisrubri TaxID=1685382 RepID=A0A0W7WK29_9RHOB|nr:nitrous oxide reductase accessory protein NosL [Pseudoponticoccus marisrubri]KUF10910.1 copper resistance protein CopZ [Pseudoponticoccus marisrubri]
MRATVLIALLLLGACKEEVAELPAPVEITAEAAGFYCQMELIEHDGPKGQIHLDGMPAPLFFSQVRDALAYLHMPEQSHAFTVAYVQDMSGATWQAPGPWIPVTEALYVIGSDRRGGMDAPELVPFSDAAAAQAFIARHGGSLRRFDEIGTADVLEAAPAPETMEETDLAQRLRRLTNEGN